MSESHNGNENQSLEPKNKIKRGCEPLDTAQVLRLNAPLNGFVFKKDERKLLQDTLNTWDAQHEHMYINLRTQSAVQLRSLNQVAQENAVASQQFYRESYINDNKFTAEQLNLHQAYPMYILNNNKQSV